VDEFIEGWAECDASCNNLTHHINDKISGVDEQISLLQRLNIDAQSSQPFEVLQEKVRELYRQDDNTNSIKSHQIL